MASEKEKPAGEDVFALGNFLTVQSANEEAASLESVRSTESESASSLVTQIDVAPSSSSSSIKLVEACDSIQGVNAANFPNAKIGDQSSSTSSSPWVQTKSGQYDERKPGIDPNLRTEDVKKPVSESPEGGIEGEEEKEDDRSYEDDTISSEAVVDDIELILMPEIAQEFPAGNLSSPQLVRVTQLRRGSGDEYDGDVFEDEGTDQESDFKKFGTDDEEGVSERSVSSTSKLQRRVVVSSSGGLGQETQQGPSNRDYDKDKKEDGRKPGGKVSSGVQTEITALETTIATFVPFEFKRRSSGKSFGRMGIPGTGKRINWKSELNLLPSKTKIRQAGFESINYQDQYSPRVTKFTSQDALSSNSQFLRPITSLYRTRNLSRNLNQLDESTLVNPAGSSESHRFRNQWTSSTSWGLKDSSYVPHVPSSVTRPQPLASGASFRSSLPDLSRSPRTYEYRGHKGSLKSKRHKSTSGQKLTKKSSSEEETSSLIDESERCLRSSIDMLLTDDLPSPAADLSCRSVLIPPSTTTKIYGYHSARRSTSQPILIDDSGSDEFRNVEMGSPFLPRKLGDMRCSRWAKVILPNGHVAVVAVKEIDEIRETLTIHTDSGCILCLPFRKVVFAWRMRR